MASGRPTAGAIFARLSDILLSSGAILSASLPSSSTALKCLLRLLEYPDYRAPAASLPPHPKWSKSRCDRFWRQLQQQGLVDFEVIVTRFGLSATGRVLLLLDTSVLPVTPDEKYILQSCRDRSIHPDQVCAKVSRHQRQPLIAGLARQGLIRITRQTVGEVWLTPAGAALVQESHCTLQAQPPTPL